MELVIASLNSHKILELREIFKTLLPSLELRSLFDFPTYKPLKETACSFVENAKAKAIQAASTLQVTCIADDFGLVIPSLGGEARTFQKRYETLSQSAVVQAKELLKEMQRLKDFERSAYLECSIAIAIPKGHVKHASARCEGLIAENERGKISFEFDTIFIKHDYSKTLAELPTAVRSRISYRRKACEKLVREIESLKSSL